MSASASRAQEPGGGAHITAPADSVEYLEAPPTSFASLGYGTVIRVEDVVVTATRTPLPLSNTPVITRVISGAEIEAQGIANIEDLLSRELAGIEFHQAGYGTTVSFQGLDARYVLFLIDGERMSGETYGNIDYQRIPLSNIDRIEIVRGAASVLYGSSAMGAVVNVITKMPNEKVEVAGTVRWGTRFQKNSGETLAGASGPSELEEYRDKLDLQNVKADLSVGFNLGKFRSLTSAAFRTSDAYKLYGRRDEERHYATMSSMTPKMSSIAPGRIPEFEVKQTFSDTTIYTSPDDRGLAVSGWRDWSVRQKFDYRLNAMFRFELSGNYYSKERFDFRTSVMDDNPMSAYFGSSGPWQYEMYEGYGYKFLMEHSPGRNNKIYLTFSRDEYRRYAKTYGQGRTPKQRHIYNIPRLLWTTKIGYFHRLTTGVEFTDERLRFDLNGGGGYGKVEKINTFSAYLQDEISTNIPLRFVVGARADWSDKFGWMATPQASVKYSLGDFTLRANYSMGYRMPSLKEMYMVLDIPVAGSPKILGNPDLKQERNNYLSFSVSYDTRRLHLSATLGQSFFRDKIDVRGQVDATGNYVLKYENVDKSEQGTVELVARYNITRDLAVQASYNYIYEHDNAPDGSTQYIFPSPHTAVFSVDYNHRFHNVKIFANANLRYVGPKDYEDFMPYIYIPDAMAGYITNPTGPPSAEVIQAMREFKYFTGTYKSRHKGYAVVNASAGVEFNPGISLTVGVDNIFDYRPRVVNFNSALLPGVNGFVQLGFAF